MIDVSIAEVRRFTGIGEDIVSSEAIEEQNAYAYSLLKGKTNFAFEPVTVTEYYDGDGTGDLVIENYPIQYVYSLIVDDEYVEEYASTPTEYENIAVYSDSGIIKLKNSLTFSIGVQNIEIQYSYVNDEAIDLASTLLYYMVCVDTLLIGGNVLSEGTQRNSFDDYTIAYDGLPYGAQIRFLQAKINDILDNLGNQAGVDFI